MGRRKRRRVDPTDDWQQLELLCVWEEQREYERIRPLVLLGGPVPGRSAETGVSERVLYRKIAAFREEGMESLFSSPKAKRRVLHPAIRRKIVDLKAEHPPLNLEEIANICGTRFERRLDASGYARVKHWRVYDEEGLASCEVAFWLGDGEMALEYGGRTLSRYDVSLSLGAKPESVTTPRLFASPYEMGQPKLFALSALGEGGWIKAMWLKGYAPSSPGRPKVLQQALFPYAETLQRGSAADRAGCGGRSRRSILGGGDPEPAAVGVPDLDLPPPRGLFHLRAELGRRDYDDQGTPTHEHASTPRDRDRARVRGTAQRTPPTRR